MSKVSDFIGGVIGLALIGTIITSVVGGNSNESTTSKDNTDTLPPSSTSDSVIVGIGGKYVDPDYEADEIDDPNEKYFTVIGVNFPSSLLLSNEHSATTIYVDGIKIGTISEGEKRAFVMYLSEGAHELKATRVLTDRDLITFNVHNDHDYGIFVENYIGIEYAYGLYGTRLSLCGFPSCSDDEYIYTDSWIEYAKSHEDVYYF